MKKKVVYVEGKELAIDSVISILEKELPECKGLSRPSLLGNASAILGCKLTQRKTVVCKFVRQTIYCYDGWHYDTISCVLFF